MKAGDRVDLYEAGVYDDSGYIIEIKGELARIEVDADADFMPDYGEDRSFWVSLTDLREEGDDDPGYDPTPRGDEGSGMFPTFALID